MVEKPHKSSLELSARVRELLLKGLLPYAPTTVYAGPEHDHHRCALCEEPLKSQEMVYEVDVALCGEKKAIYLHPNCHRVWHSESELLRRLRDSAPST